MMFPASSRAFEILYTAKTDATVIHRVSNASHLPGQILMRVYWLVSIVFSLVIAAHRRPNPKVAIGSSLIPASFGPSNRSGLNSKGSGYVSSSWQIALQLGMSIIVVNNFRKDTPKIRNHSGTFRNPITFIYIIFRGRVWQTQRHHRIPSHYLPNNMVDVRQLVTVRKLGKTALRPKYTVEFFLSLQLRLWIKGHCKQECMQTRNSLGSE